MNRIPFSLDSLKELVTSPIIKPSSIGFIGKDYYQIDTALNFIFDKFCKDKQLRAFNIDNFSKEDYPKVSNALIAQIDSTIREAPISSNLRIVVINHNKIQVKSNNCNSSLVIYINSQDIDKCDVVFTTYPLYGKHLLSFTRSFIKANPPLSKYFDKSDDINFICSHLYSGNTLSFIQELKKLQKVAIAFPLDFYIKAKEYISENSESQINTIYSMIRQGQAQELSKFIYKAIFIDKILSITQVFNILAQHFFVNFFIFLSCYTKRTLHLPEDVNYVFDFFNESVEFDSCLNCCVIKPLNTNFLQSHLTVCPSINLIFNTCSSLTNCSSKNFCSLAKKILSFISFDNSSDFKGCPLLQPSIKSLLSQEILNKIPDNLLYALSSNKDVLKDKKNFSTVKPLGLMTIKQSRVFSIYDLFRGISLFREADKTFKSEELFTVEVSSIFIKLINYLIYDKFQED